MNRDGYRFLANINEWTEYYFQFKRFVIYSLHFLYMLEAARLVEAPNNISGNDHIIIFFIVKISINFDPDIHPYNNNTDE